MAPARRETRGFAAPGRSGPAPTAAAGCPACAVLSSAAISAASTGPEKRKPWPCSHSSRAQPFELLVRLDALGQGHQPEGAAELDERVDQGGGVGRPAHVRHEGPVDLQNVHRELPQIGQRRVPGAEVVDGDLDAQLLQEVEPAHRGDGVPHEGGLGDFEDEHGGVETVGGERATDVVEELVGVELPHGDVDPDAGVVPLPMPGGRFPAGLVEHPTADVDDEPSLFEHRDEDVRRDDALGGVLPAQERFDTLDLNPFEIEDRVVHQRELVVLERPLQVRLEGEPLVGRRLHGVLEEDGLVAARPLGPVESDVGVAQEILGRRAIADRDPDARRHGDRHVVDPGNVEGRPEDLVHPFGDHLGTPGEREAVGENDELVAAESPDGVARAQNAEQPSRHQLQQLVARPVSQGVVGVLEIVQIDEEGRHGGTRTPGPHQHLLCSVENQLTVRQSRQRIVQRAMGQEGLELLALGDVTDVGDIPGHRRAVRLVRDHGFDVAVRPVSAHHAELERRRSAA